MGALATVRRTCGLAATSIDLGVVSEAGYLAENPDQLKTYSQAQTLYITNSDLRHLLSAVIKGHTLDGSPVPAQIIAGFGTELFAIAGCQKEGKFLQAVHSSDVSMDGEAGAGAIRKSLADTTSIREAARDVEEELVARIGRALGIEKSDIDVTKPLHAYGGT
jgi:hypothetical protein